MTRGPLLVQKFGGTSVSTPERRGHVVAHVARARAEGQDVVAIVSAMGRRGDPYATDTLLDLLRADGADVDAADHDLMFTCGEAISAALISHTLKRAGIPAVALTAVQARIFTDERHVEADIRDVDTVRLREVLAAGTVPVVTGGQGVMPGTLDYTTLGRGGSDTSAVAIGVALGARRVDIFTDVKGVATIDPRVAPPGRFLERISYGAMFELARFGAKVLHPRAVLAGWRGSTPIAVRSTRSTSPGTLVDDVVDENPIVGFALLSPMHTRVLPPGAVDASRLADWERVRLVMHLTDARSSSIVIGATADKLADLRAAVREAGVQPIGGESTCCWLSIVGDGNAVRDRAGCEARRLEALGIERVAHEVSERRCTFVVPEAERDRAARAVYADVFESATLV